MEPEVIILKPAELILKSKGVRKQFEKRLFFNIKDCLKKNEIEFDHIVMGQGRYFIYTPEIEEVLSKIKNIFGISNICAAIQVGAEINTIKSTVLELAEELGVGKKSSFGIRATTISSNINMSSQTIEREVGTFIQEKTKSQVNLTKPDFWLRIEIIGPKAFIYSEIIEGFSGLPLGTGGKSLALINENENSILASWLIMKRGCEIIPIHFRTDEKKLNQFQKNVKKLEKFAWGSRIKSISVKEKFDIKNIEKLAQEFRAKAIILGSTEPSLLKSDIPIFEPLVGLDKKELKTLNQIIF